MRDHTEIEELLAARALGGIDDADRHRLAELLATHGECDECLRIERESVEVAAHMAAALTPSPVPPQLEDRVLGRARAAGTPGAGRHTNEIPPREREIRAVEPTRRARRWLRPLASAAAAIALFAAGWVTASGTASSRSGRAFPLGGTRVAVLQGTGAASLAAVYRPGSNGVALVGDGFEPAPGGRTYELWLFRGETPVRMGCFRPRADGEVVAFVDGSVSGGRSLAVTQEPGTCPAAPSAPPILTAPI